MVMGSLTINSLDAALIWKFGVKKKIMSKYFINFFFSSRASGCLLSKIRRSNKFIFYILHFLYNR